MPKKSSKKKIKLKKKKSALHPETKKSIVAIVCFTLALLSLLSYFKAAGSFGGYFLKIGQIFFGQGFFLIPIGLVLAGLVILMRPNFTKQDLGEQSRFSYRPIIIGLILFIFSILGIFHILGGQEGGAIKSGGYLGLAIGLPLGKFLGFWASLIVLLAVLLVSILIIFNTSLKKKIKGTEEDISKKVQDENKNEKEGTIDLTQSLEPIEPPSKEMPEEDDASYGQKEKKQGLFDRWKEKAGPSFQMKKMTKDEGGELEAESQKEKIAVKAKKDLSFKSPPLDLLEKDKGQPTSGDIKANVNIIQRTLQNFGIEVEMAEVNIGPTVTQYTLRPAQGIKLSRIIALQNDLSLALAAHPLRLEAPIPGRPLVGIEIPNRSAVLVRLRNLLESSSFKELSSSMSFAMGRNVAGRPVFSDLARMPHLLVAGATGAGKTISINSLLVSLLYQNSPETLRLILIDPKRVEFTPYNDIPHLLTPVIVQPEKAVNALRWTVGEMDRRFDVLQANGARDISSYNKKMSKDKMPYIAVVIDELADLMSSRGREVEALIVRLAQMARAVGIHLVVATQRPSVEVITGLIKANITSRLALQVASQIDSRTILDSAGAEKLLGQGDMLYLSGDSAKPRRIQGTYISDKEIKKLVAFLRKSQMPEYNQDVVETGSASGGLNSNLSIDNNSSGASETDDELYEKAKEVIGQAGRASASLLQRRLRVGYARAARLLDTLEQEGVIGPAEGAKPREVLVKEEDRGNI